MKSLIGLCLSCCLLFSLVSCSSKSPAVDDGAQKQVVNLSSIAVLPVRIQDDDDKHIPGTDNEQLLAGAAVADNVIREQFAGNEKIKVVTTAELNRIGNGITGGLEATVGELGKALGCDAVLVTTLRRYKQREGGEYAVEAPASASFTMTLMSSEDRRVLWVADFNETQQSLMENIFSFGKAQSRGFKWIAVEDLLSQGLKERLAEFPYM